MYDINQSELRNFLYQANLAGYASGELKNWQKETDDSTSITFSQGKWRMHDNFFGGEPYGGRLVVFYNQKPVWMMIYYGLVVGGFDKEKVYPFLQNALKDMPKDVPLRGPRKLEVNNFRYLNSWEGELENYFGKEEIYFKNKLVYWAKYMGGLVDRQ